MQFKIDQELYIGCGACEETCPEIFELYDDLSYVVLDPVPEELQASALDAEAGCPVEAISHEDCKPRLKCGGVV
jgi:ferredoxin